MNMRPAITTAIAVPSPLPFTAADYLAIERMVGHEVSTCLDGEKLFVCVYFGNRKYGRGKKDAHIEGLRRFRAWQSATPDWKEQIAAELTREQSVGTAPKGDPA